MKVNVIKVNKEIAVTIFLAIPIIKKEPKEISKREIATASICA
jgi:hypothetical protein